MSPSAPRQPSLRHARRRRRHPFVRGTAVTAVGLAAFALTGSAVAYTSLQGNITTRDITALLGEDRPSADAEETSGPVDPSAGRQINVLVMGSDVRTGDNAVLGGSPDVEGMRSDTTLLVHISADRSRADIASIPRDLLVDIPACPLPDGTESRPQSSAMFNSAFAIGGDTGRTEYAAACATRTVEGMTGVYIDDYVVIDFAGFAHMVDALGGVPLCLPEAVSDRYAGLDLPAGDQVLDGQQALAFARARKNVGDGSDISRIGRQQLLLGAMVRQILAKNLLTDLPSLYKFLDAATSSVTAGPTLGQIPNLVGLANSLRTVPASGITFVTVPFDWAGNRVAPNADSAALWAAIAADTPIAPEAPAPDATPADGATTTDGSTAPEPAPTTSAGSPWEIVTGETQSEGGVCG